MAAALANGLEPDGDVDAIAASQLLDEIAWFESSGIDPLDASSGDLEADARRGGE